MPNIELTLIPFTNDGAHVFLCKVSNNEAYYLPGVMLTAYNRELKEKSRDDLIIGFMKCIGHGNFCGCSIFDILKVENEEEDNSIYFLNTGISTNDKIVNSYAELKPLKALFSDGMKYRYKRDELALRKMMQIYK